MTDQDQLASQLATMAAMIIEDIDTLRLIADRPPTVPELAVMRGQVANAGTLIAAAEIVRSDTTATND